MPSGRFFGFVIGGTHPAALAADWLTGAWDQNAGLRTVTPAATAVEDVAEAWVIDLLGLPGRERGRVRHRRHDGQLHLPGGGPRRGARPGGLGRRRARASSGRRASGCWWGRSGTTRSTWCCATSASARPSRWRPTPRGGSTWPRCGPGSTTATAGPPSSRCRRATSTRVPSTRSPRRSRWRTTTARGSTSTARSGCSPRRRPGTGTWSPATRPPTRGRPTPTRRSTSRTTAGSRSSATRPRCGPRCRWPVPT